MSLPAYLPSVQGSRMYLGPDSAAIEDTFIVNPGNSDYPVGGYVITPIMLRLKLIAFAWVSGWNDLAAGYVGQAVFDMRQLASPILGGGVGGPGQGLPYSQTLGPGVVGYQQINFKILTGAAAQSRLTEATVNTDFFGCGWFLTVRGQ